MIDVKSLKEFTKILSVLYVEDETLLQESVKEYLQKIFKKVVCASNGEEGLSLYKKHLEDDEKFNIIITDIEMPFMNGLDMSKAIKDIDSRQEIIVVSAYTNIDYFLKSIKIGVGGYVIKPMDYSQLNEILYNTAIRIIDHIKIAEYENQLELRVQEEIEKNKLNQKMLLEQSKMASMGEMLESIAHQWRQPLSVITTAASGLKMEKEFGILTDEEFYKTLDAIFSAAQHLSQTIDDFRDFFKANKNEENFHIGESFNRAKELLSSKFKNREIEVIETIEDITLFGMINDLVQVFMNLLNNSKDVLEELTDKRRLIFIDIKKVADDVIICLKDGGGGIKNDIIDRVFDSHFTTKENKDGTGIGLYMTQQIIKEHLKGKIEVQNVEFEYEGENYNGAQFTIIFPFPNK